MKHSKLIALFIALMLVATTAFAEADTTEHSHIYFGLENAGVRVLIGSSWEEAARAQQVFVTVDTDYAEDGTLASSLVMLAPSDYYSTDGTMDTSGVLFAVQAFKDGTPDAERLGTTELAAFKSEEVGSSNGYTYLYRENPSPNVSGLSEDMQAICTNVLQSFADETPQHLIEMVAPPSEREALSALGMFATTDLDGNPVGPEIFEQAKLTIVSVWGTYCSACISEMPTMAKLAEEYKDKGVQFVGIVADAYDEETAELGRTIAEKYGLPYTNLVPDIVMTQKRLQYVMYLPTKLVLDSTGAEIAENIVGASDEATMRTTIDALLAQVDADAAQ